MTQTFTTDSNNDIFIFGDGLLSVSSGLQGVLKACETAARAQLGEMLLSVNRGVPNFQTVWSSRRNLAQFESLLRSTLEAVSGVIRVNELTVKTEGNVVKYTARIESAFGAGVING